MCIGYLSGDVTILRHEQPDLFIDYYYQITEL